MAGITSHVKLPDVLVLRQIARDQLKLQLESIEGRKDLVLDPELMRSLDRIAGASFLKEHGVDKIFKLESSKSLQGCNQRIYIVRPKVELIRYISDQINTDRNGGTKRTSKILMVPRKLHKCELVLEQEGVWGYVTLEELPIDWIPLDQDILSLELPQFLPATFLDQDESWIHTSAKSFVTIQQLFGSIANVYLFGHCAHKTYELAELLTGDEENSVPQEISHAFLIDRACDFVTPLLSQVTYEGLLDDMININCGYIDFTKEVTGKDGTIKMLLTCSDQVYQDIRDRHFSSVFTFLSGKAKELQAGYDKRHDLQSVSDMKNFVAEDLKGLKQQHKSLSLHVGACEFITKNKTKGSFVEILQTEHTLLEGIQLKENISFIEESIALQTSHTMCLRLLCLMSLTTGGLSSTLYKDLKTQYCQSFGYDSLVKFHALRRLGLLTEVEQSGTSRGLGKVAAAVSLDMVKGCPFRTLCKKLGLVPKSGDEVDLRSPSDMSYVFSGAYAPMLCKLVEQVLSRGSLSSLEETVKLLPGPASCKTGPSSARGGGKASHPRVVLVYFLGGCTFSEITALRFLGKQTGVRFLVATTSIFNVDGLLRQVTS